MPAHITGLVSTKPHFWPWLAVKLEKEFKTGARTSWCSPHWLSWSPQSYSWGVFWLGVVFLYLITPVDFSSRNFVWTFSHGGEFCSYVLYEEVPLDWFFFSFLPPSSLVYQTCPLVFPRLSVRNISFFPHCLSYPSKYLSFHFKSLFSWFSHEACSISLLILVALTHIF